MECHLDREIRLSDTSKYESLYSWSLQEFDENGKQIGEDQIPWQWTLWFTASELTHNESITNEYNDDEASVSESETVTAKQYPGDWRDGYLENDVMYSMFGTNRQIKEFSLRIQPLKEDEYDDSMDDWLELDESEKQKRREEREKERCRLWGCVSYTAEVDFRDETQDDIISVYLYLKPERFNSIATAVKERQVDALVLRMGKVSGFYSEWSPEISTRRVKVLTASSNDHSVNRTEECKITRPRLGHVGEFWISFTQTLDLSTNARKNEKFLIDDIAEEVPTDFDEEQQPKLATSDLLIAQLKRNELVINRLKKAVWFVFGVLVLILIKVTS